MRFSRGRHLSVVSSPAFLLPAEYLSLIHILRDWLKVNWDFSGDAPQLPAEVIGGTSARYREAYEIITGEKFVPMKSK